jgi:hypothetical protein
MCAHSRTLRGFEKLENPFFSECMKPHFQTIAPFYALNQLYKQLSTIQPYVDTAKSEQPDSPYHDIKEIGNTAHEWGTPTLDNRPTHECILDKYVAYYKIRCSNSLIPNTFPSSITSFQMK